MKPDVVVDVGNSRMKWGLCKDDRVSEFVSLPFETTADWDKQYANWGLSTATRWAVCGVNPVSLAKLVGWIRKLGAKPAILSSFGHLPIKVSVQTADKVGVDRLLNAVAAKNRNQRETSSFIIDAGTAVTVDWVDRSGEFRGGAILPGMRLMAKSLHDYTALLPLLDASRIVNPSLPGTSTETAISAGIFWAVAGGIKAVLHKLMVHESGHDKQPIVFLTGGDAHLLEPVMDEDFIAWPQMTLEGIRLSAEKLP